MQTSQESFKPYVSPLGAWALSFGCTIGWGAFLVPGTFLPSSGVMGSIVGIVIGAFVMLVIAWNYHAMINRYPEAGGAFSFTSRVLGYDHGFLCAWFLCLMYLGLIWANVSAFALLARYTLGDAFHAHLLYSVAGFDIYLEETMLCGAALLAAGAICLFRNRFARRAQILFALTLAVGMALLFALVVSASPLAMSSVPLYAPDGTHAIQILRTLTVVPWAYVGFESVSHSAQEFSFSRKKTFRIMVFAIAMAMFAYVSMLLLSVRAVPEGYANWVAYVSNLGSMSGLSSVPTFSAISLTLGKWGIALLQVTMLGALFSSLVGNLICLSRLVYSMAQGGIFPSRLGAIAAGGIPRNALIAIIVVSLPMPLLGRTAIGWNVDISNVGATIAYGYTSIVAYRLARASNNAKGRVLGAAGTLISVAFLVLMLLPNNALAQESYLIFAGWIVLGFTLNHHVLKKDEDHRYGRSSIVWIALLLLTVYTAISFVWQSGIRGAQQASEAIQMHAAYDTASETGTPPIPIDSDDFVSTTIEGFRHAQMRDFLIVIVIIIYSFRILLGNYAIANEREIQIQKELGKTRDKAYKDKLTGVKNVNAYRERERDINAAIQEGSLEMLAVVVCDLNDLKKVNDTQGHQAGDNYIREGCKVICNTFEHSPVFRIGGDEFVALLEGVDFRQREKLINLFERDNTVRLHTGGVVIALGSADWRPGEDATLADVFARADATMYERKKALKAQKASS